MSTVLFQAPQGMVSSKRAQVLVNGEELFLYETRVHYLLPYYEVKKVPFGYFDSWEKVKVEVRFPDPAEKVIVRPLKRRSGRRNMTAVFFLKWGLEIKFRSNRTEIWTEPSFCFAICRNKSQYKDKM